MTETNGSKVNSVLVEALAKFAANSPFAVLLGFVLYMDFTGRIEMDREFIKVSTLQVEAANAQANASAEFAAAVRSIAETNQAIAREEQKERQEMLAALQVQGKRRDAEIEVLTQILRELKDR